MSTEGIEDERQILAFALGDERYCLDIGHVGEIVDVDEITRVPDTPDHVEGVMDLRGVSATIVDPKRVFGVDGEADGDYVIVLDRDGDGPVGWLVDAVYSVTTVEEDAIDRGPADGAVEGVVRRDDGFLVWVAPDAEETPAEHPD